MRKQLPFLQKNISVFQAGEDRRIGVAEYCRRSRYGGGVLEKEKSEFSSQKLEQIKEASHKRHSCHCKESSEEDDKDTIRQDSRIGQHIELL